MQNAYLIVRSLQGIVSCKFIIILIMVLVLQSLKLILMKAGGRIIYFGPLGQHSSRVIEYFEVSFPTTIYPTSFSSKI